jgi:hypothetical protein
MICEGWGEMDQPINGAAGSKSGVRDPKELEARDSPTTAGISPLATPGPVHLAVSGWLIRDPSGNPLVLAIGG